MTTVVRPIHQSLRCQESVSSPKSIKHVGINCVSYGFISVIGKQRAMEDAVAVVPGFVVGELATYDFFAVYDGHGGDQVATSCRDRLHQLVAEEVERVKLGLDFERRKLHWEKVMSNSFNAMNEEVGGGGGSEIDVAMPVEVSERTTVGSTAVVVVVGKEEIVVANCGNSRAVMSRNGVAFALSSDHKPDRSDEFGRIEATVNRQIFCGDGNAISILAMLGVSRSIDRSRRPFILPEPEVRVVERDDRSDFIIIATDGLWDVITNEFACEVVGKCFCRQHLKNFGFSDESSGNNAAAEAAAMLAELAMARGSKDNISVIVVELKSLKSSN